MQLHVGKQKKIISILKTLPVDKVDELIDFAEYLKTRKKPVQKQRKEKQSLRVPTFHLGYIEKNAFDRDALYGEYLDRKFD